MNWQRGAFRIWVVVGILWVTTLSYLLGPKYISNYFDAVEYQVWLKDHPPKKYMTDGDLSTTSSYPKPWYADINAPEKWNPLRIIIQASGLLFSLPAFLLAVWIAILWIIRGFKAR